MSADPSRKITLHYSLQYTSCDLAAKNLESKPVVKLYLSSQFNRDYDGGGIVNIHLDEDHLEKVYSGTLSGTLKREFGAVPTMAAIGMASFAIHRNDHGHACYVNVGTSHANLGAVINSRNAAGTAAAYDKEHDLLMRTVVINGMAPVKKGTIRLKVTRVEMGPTLINAPLARSPLSAPMQSIEATLANYINATMARETRLPDIFPGIERVRAPMEISQIGIESSGTTFLPVIAFGMTEAPPASPEYFVNAFERVMARRNLPIAAWNDFDDFEKCRTLAQIISYEVQSYDYISDGVEISSRKRPQDKPRLIPTEEFSIGNTMADDCESVGSAISVIHKGFRALDLDSPAPVGAGISKIGRAYPSPERLAPLREMQSISKDYYQLLMLSVVHGAKIGDEEGFGAHMYLRMMPEATFRAGLSRTSEGRALLKRMGPAKAPEGVFGRVGRSAMGPTDRPDRVDMICEGTGKIDPIGYTDPLYEQRKYIGIGMPSTNGFKKEIPREYLGASPFYYLDMMAVSSEIEDRYGVAVGGFTFGTVNPNYNPSDPNNQHEMVRGALFTDVMAASDKIAILPHPVAPEPVMKIVKEAIALRPPFDPLVLNMERHRAGAATAAPAARKIGEAAGSAGSHTHPLWDKLQLATRKLNRTGPDTRTHPSVDLFVRPHQFDAHVVNAMIGDVARLDRIYDVQYEYEPMRGNHYTWRVRLFVK